MVIDEMCAVLGTTGILQGKTDYGSAASIRQQERLRRHARNTADRLLTTPSNRSKPTRNSTPNTTLNRIYANACCSKEDLFSNAAAILLK